MSQRFQSKGNNKGKSKGNGLEMIDFYYIEGPSGPSIDFPFNVPDEFLDDEEDEEEMNMMEEIGRILNYMGVAM
jgi:hypothetical protein